MQIQTTTDNMIEQSEPLTRHVESVVKESLGTLSKKIAIVVVRLSDTNDYRSKSGDHRCMMEARIEGHPWVAASAHGISLHQAIRSAAEKLKQSIEARLVQTDNNVLILPAKPGFRKQANL
ncbi:MAG: HPF/RaiA family ribosome-associated protein [Burkholderiaceae bacterium]